MSQIRSLYMVISPKSLSYARFAIESLLARTMEPVHLHLITDSQADRELLTAYMATIEHGGRYQWSVHAEDDLAEREAMVFSSALICARSGKGIPAGARSRIPSCWPSLGRKWYCSIRTSSFRTTSGLNRLLITGFS